MVVDIWNCGWFMYFYTIIRVIYKTFTNFFSLYAIGKDIQLIVKHIVINFKSKQNRTKHSDFYVFL